MIRQAISCDICGTEKRQTNHWFVAYEQSGELRIGGWKSRHRLRADAKHLCGQTCLHKLVDEFIAQCINQRPARAAEPGAESSLVGDTSLTSAAAYPKPDLPKRRGLINAAIAAPNRDMELDATPEEPESSARLLDPPASLPSRPASPSQPEIVTMPLRPKPDQPPPSPGRYNSRSWRAEAWERERERELRAQENHPDIAARRRTRA